MKDYLVGVDIGTAGTKSGLFDSQGNLVAEAYQESSLRHPRPGWAEQEMADFYRSAVTTVRQVVRESKVAPARIAAVAVAGQMSGIGMIDRNWEPVAHYDSWLDTRCEPYIRRMQSQGGLEVLRKTGCPPTYAHCAKILWWQGERPDAFRRIAKFVVPGCYVAGKLAGLNARDAFVDHTYLHYTGLADIQKLEWDDDLCRLFGVPREVLPRIVRSTEIVGHLTPQAAQECGLPSGVPIAAGAGDTTTSYLGAGVVEPGILFDVAGTASVLASCTTGYSPDVKHGTMMCSRSVIAGLWNPIAFINGGGLCLRWFRDEIADWKRSPAERGDRDPYEYLNDLAAGAPPGSGGLLFVPHLGGRVLPVQPSLRGSWVGFSWGQSKAHLYRSILEGIAYEYHHYYAIMKDLYPDIRFREVRVLGGGARSSLWNQIKADVLGVPYVRVTQREPAILGSAIVAGAAVGLFSDVAETSRRFVGVSGRIEPRPDHHAYYRGYAEAYSRVLDNLLGSYRDLEALRGLVPPGGADGRAGAGGSGGPDERSEE
jgi:xylulokinase